MATLPPRPGPRTGFAAAVRPLRRLGGAAVALGLLAVASCTPAPAPTTPPATTTPPASPTAGAPSWTRTAPVPSGFSFSPLTAWVDGAFLVIGGSPDAPGTTEDGRNSTNGQRYDPDSDTWQAIAAAPAGFSQSDTHVVLGDVLYVVTEEFEDARKDPGGGPWLCAAQALHSYDLSADAWSELPLPAGNCSLAREGLVATGDALVALDIGWKTSWNEDDPQWEPTYPAAVSAVFDPGRAAWQLRTLPAELTPSDAFRWATWTGEELLVTLESIPQGSSSNTATATPSVYAWDYRADTWQRVDQPGSEALDWTNWTGRVVTPSGPAYFQGGALLGFDRASGTFHRTSPHCGDAACAELDAGQFSYFGTGVSNLGVFPDGWTVVSSASDFTSLFLLQPATGETVALPTLRPPDPTRAVLDAVAVAGAPGVILSCPITPSWYPDGDLVDDLTPPIADLTLADNTGAGEPGALIRVTVRDDTAADPGPVTYEVLAVGADGVWAYTDSYSAPRHSTVLAAEYLRKQDLQPFCYLLRH